MQDPNGGLGGLLGGNGPSPFSDPDADPQEELEERHTEPSPDRDVLVIGGDLSGVAAALSAVRNGARTRLLVQAGQAPGPVEPIPEDPVPIAREEAKRRDVPSPEEPQVFRFRSRRVRRWLEELDIPNDEDWARSLHDAMMDRLEREGAAVDQTSVAVRLIGDAEEGISGAVIVDGEDCTTHTADTTILAGGGARFLWPSEDDQPEATPPSGLALALRAELPVGDLSKVAWTEDDQPLRFVDGVHGDGRGHCEVPGVAACGETLANPSHGAPELAYLEDVVRGLEAGGFQGPPAASGDPELVPLVDNPMPAGFASVKLSRLRGTVERYLGSDASEEDVDEAHAALLSLRGEFADYARARAEPDLHILYQAADVALAFADACQEDA